MQRSPRTLLVLRPTDAFAAWVVERMPIFAGDEAHIRTDGEAYLLPQLADRAQAEAWVEARWRFFLEQQLMDWVPDRRRWPRRPTRGLFRDWFDCEIREVLWDLALHH